jgi:hypothetical protein
MRAGRGKAEMTAELASVLVLAAGQPPVTSGREAAEMNGADLVPVAMLRVWEDVYRDYLAASLQMDAGDVGKEQVLAHSSARLAVTWRRMADVVPVGEWWLRAVLLTAAEAMEWQAGDLSAYLRRPR